MSLLFNTLYRFVIVLLPRRKHLLILWLQSPSTVILEPKTMKSITVSTFSPSICCEVMELVAMIFIFLNIEFLSQFFHSSFTLIERLFNSSLLSAIRVVSSAYLRLSVFSLEILIPDCASSSLAFCMMLNKLNMLDDDIQPSCTLLPIWNHSVVPCLVLEATGPLCFL